MDGQHDRGIAEQPICISILPEDFAPFKISFDTLLCNIFHSWRKVHSNHEQARAQAIMGPKWEQLKERLQV